MDIAAILHVLRALRRRVRTLFFLHGLIALLWLSAVVVFLFAADYFLVLPAGARLVLLGGGSLLVVVTLYRKLLVPLRARLSDDDMALCVERAFPALGEKLISTVQLARRMDPDSLKIHSQEMVERTARQALEEMKTVSLGPVLRSRSALRTFLMGSVVLAGLGTLAALNPSLSSIFMNRALGGPAQWPQRTELSVLDPQAQIIKVARGENFLVKVLARREVPSRVRVSFTFPATGDEGESDMVRLGSDTFQYLFTNVVADFKFHVRGGDAVSQSYTVKVMVPPKVKDVRVRLAFPPHTKRTGAAPGSWDQTDGNIKAPVGTVVTVNAGTSKATTKARIEFSKRGLKAIDMKTMPDGRVQGTFPITLSGVYTIKLHGSEGLSNRIPARFAIRAVPDQAPLVKLSWPRYNEQISAQASLPVAGLVKDDYGVAFVRVLLRRPGVQDADKTLATDLDIPDREFGEEEVDVEHVVEVSSLSLKGGDGKERPVAEGDVILLRVEALDHRPSPAPNRMVTREVQLEVVSKAELERAIEARMIRIKERIAKIVSLQTSVRDRMVRLQEALGEEHVWDRGDLEQLLSCEITQRRVTRDSDRVHSDFVHVMERVIYNKLGDPDYIRKLREMGEMMALVAGERSPEALKRIEEARLAGEREPQNKAAADAITAQNTVLQILGDILTRMKKWEDYNEILRAVRDLREMQKKILEHTNDYTKGKSGKKKDG